MCREWLNDPATTSESRLIIPAGIVLPQAIAIEIKRILTFDDVLITSAVDADSGLCYTKLFSKSGGPGSFINPPLEMIAGPEPAPELSASPTETTKPATRPRLDRKPAIESPLPHRPYRLCSNRIVLGSSALEKTNSANHRSGRFYPSDDYFEVAEIFAAFPQAENDWMETNAREAYGLTEDNASEHRRRFNDLVERIEALELFVADETGKPIPAEEVRLEDLSQHYDDESERWLHVHFKD